MRVITIMIMTLTRVFEAIALVPAVTVDNISVRMSLPDGLGLSGVCLFRNGLDKRHVVYKSITSTHKHQKNSKYLVAGDLNTNSVYEGIFTRLQDGDQIARFVCKEGYRFEIATPFIVPIKDLENMFTVKESIQQKLKMYPLNRMLIENVSVTIRFLLDHSQHVVTADVFQVFKKLKQQNIKNAYSAIPFARYQLSLPVHKLILAELPPDQMIAIKIHAVDFTGKPTENFFFLFTGGLYPTDIANLTQMVDNLMTPGNMINTKHGQYDSYDILKNTVRCYADGMVYNGYPCKNSDKCIPLGWLCDDQKDCVEGEDEYNCYKEDEDDSISNTNDYNNIDNWYYSRGTCKKYEFRCLSRKMSVCLPNSWLCDGRVDCDDGWDEDEFNCGQIYSVQKPVLSDIYHREDILCKNKNSFKCWQGTECINFRSVCDGIKHCADGSDERICDNWNLHCDQFTEFRCLNNYNTYNTRNCIPRQWVCDLQDDCPHGEDESVTSCLSMDHPTFNGLETDIVDF